MEKQKVDISQKQKQNEEKKKQLESQEKAVKKEVDSQKTQLSKATDLKSKISGTVSLDVRQQQLSQT